jgi:hypothetical protein
MEEGEIDATLPWDWCIRDIPAHIDLERPGIYEWRIEGAGCYIGKSKRLRARLREYPNNLRKMIAGLPYRAGKPEAFRRVHHELHAALAAGRSVTLTVLENCDAGALSERERFWIARRGTLNR